MNKLMLLGGAALLALSGTAMAQTTGSEPSPDAAATPDATTPSATAPSDATASAGTPAASGTTPSTGAPGSDAVAQTTAPAADAAATTPPATDTAAAGADAAATVPAAPATVTASADATAKVNADWAKYDTGNKGKLTPLEFGSWVLAARGQDVTAQVEKSKTSKRANLPAVKVLNATAGDFAKADTDKDHMISPNELAVYLSA